MIFVIIGSLIANLLGSVWIRKNSETLDICQTPPPPPLTSDILGDVFAICIKGTILRIPSPPKPIIKHS